MTQDDLLRELLRRGYPVTARRLTDWRAKGLLPQLVRHGSGRGPGARFAWEEPDILDHAVTVWELLDRRRRVAPALLGTWFAGYGIEISKVRDAWLSRLGTAEGRVQRNEDLSICWSEQIARQWAPKLGMPRGRLEAFVSEILLILFDPKHRVSMEDSQKFLKIANGIYSSWANSEVGFTELKSTSLQQGFDFLRHNLSLKSVQELIASTDDGGLAAAHRRWVGVMRLIGRLANSTPEPVSEESFLLRRNLAVALGRYFIVLLLYLDRHDAGLRIDATIRLISQLLDQVPNLSEWSKQIQRDDATAQLDLISNLAEIWDGFDFSRLFLATGIAR